MRTRLKQAIVASVAAFVLTGCYNVTTGPTDTAVHEAGGPMTDPKLVGCVPPGTKAREGWFGEQFHYFPTTLRSWDFSTAADSDHDGPLSVTAQSPAGQAQNISLSVSGNVTWQLNTDCETLMDFYQKIAQKYDAAGGDAGSVGDGWSSMVNFYIGSPFQKALSQNAKDFDYLELVNDPDKLAHLETTTEADTVRYIEQQAGGDYFQNITVNLQTPVLPDNIQDAINANEAARQQNQKVQTENSTRESLIRQLGQCGYLIYRQQEENSQAQAGGETPIPLPLCAIPDNVVVNPFGSTAKP